VFQNLTNSVWFYFKYLQKKVLCTFVTLSAKLFKELILINPFSHQMCLCHMLYLMSVCHGDLIEMQ